MTGRLTRPLPLAACYTEGTCMRMRGGRHEDARAFCRFVSEVVMMTVIISNCFRGGDDDGITNMTCPLLAADFRDMGTHLNRVIPWSYILA